MISNYERRNLESACDDVLALYAVYKTSKAVRARHAKLKSVTWNKAHTLKIECEVTEEPIDFMIDVDLKAKRVLTREHLVLWHELDEDPDQYINLPKRMKHRLAVMFTVNSLGPDGYYRKLYHKAKQDMDRRLFCRHEEEHDAGEIGNAAGDNYGSDYYGGDIFSSPDEYADGESWGTTTPGETEEA